MNFPSKTTRTPPAPEYGTLETGIPQQQSEKEEKGGWLERGRGVVRRGWGGRGALSSLLAFLGDLSLDNAL